MKDYKGLGIPSEMVYGVIRDYREAHPEGITYHGLEGYFERRFKVTRANISAWGNSKKNSFN